jgi:hypothetical protein
MVRKLPALLAALVAAIGAGALAVTMSSGSSHREAPLSSIDPTADDTDVYAFKAADAPNALTIVANWIPFEDPAGGPNFYRLDDRAAYYLNVDNTGDGRFDVRYRFKFKTHVLDKGSFLYALPGVSSIRDPKLNVQQTYSVVRETFRGGKETGHTVLGTMFAYPADEALLELARSVALDTNAHNAFTPDAFEVPIGAGTPRAAARIACTKVDGVLVCRAVGSQADAVRRALASIWSLIRPHVTGRAATPPRIWST